jgi:hypothetical protein
MKRAPALSITCIKGVLAVRLDLSIFKRVKGQMPVQRGLA